MKKRSIILCLALVFILSLVPGTIAESISISPQASQGIAGEETELTILIDRVPEGLSGYNITVAVENPQVTEIVNVSYPDWVSVSSINPSPPAGYVCMLASDLTGAIHPGDTDVELGYLTMRGLKQGNTAIRIDVNKLNDKSGDDIIVHTSGATVIVTSGSVPSSGGSLGGGGGGGSAIIHSSITLPSTTSTAASSTAVETATTTASTPPATTVPGEDATAQKTGAVESGDAGQNASMAESGTGEEDFPWIIIVGAFVAVVLVGLAAVGYNKSREQD